MRASVTGHERRRQANLSRGKSKTRLGRRCYIVPPDSVRRSEGVALVELAACENEQVGTPLGYVVQPIMCSRPSGVLEA